MERVAKESNLHPGWIRVFLFLPLSSQKLIWRISTKVEAYNMRIGQRYRNSSTIAPLTQVDDWRFKPSPVEHSTPATLQPPTATPRSEVDIVDSRRKTSEKEGILLPLSRLALPATTSSKHTDMWGPGGACSERRQLAIDRPMRSTHTQCQIQNSKTVVRRKCRSMSRPRRQQEVLRRRSLITHYDNHTHKCSGQKQQSRPGDKSPASEAKTATVHATTQRDRNSVPLGHDSTPELR